MPNPSDLPLAELVGFNYSLTVMELLRVYRHRDLAERLGYESPGALQYVLNGSIPSHIQGEAIWALYLDTFQRKPPLQRVARTGNRTTT